MGKLKLAFVLLAGVASGAILTGLWSTVFSTNQVATEVTSSPTISPSESQSPEPTETDEGQQSSDSDSSSSEVNDAEISPSPTPEQTFEPVLIAGPQGPQGEPGIQGPVGPVGPIGAQGIPGPMGPPGTSGFDGSTGPAGEPGLQGEPGPSGEPGPTGEPGPAGEPGEQGATGPQGERGETGAQGAVGPTGPTGATGATGPLGPTGPQGESGIVLAQSPLVYDAGSKSISLDQSAIDYLSDLGYIQFDSSANASGSVGRLFWNQEDGTLNLGLGGGQVTLQIGQEQVQLVKNTTAQTLLNGRAVQATGADSGRVSVAYADATIPERAVAVLGILTQDIAPGEVGFVTVNGMVRDVDTSFGAPGSVVYLGTEGQLVSVRPISGSVVQLGYLISSDASTGDIFVDTSYTSLPGAGLPCIAGPDNAAGIYKWELAGKGDYYLSCDITP